MADALKWRLDAVTERMKGSKNPLLAFVVDPQYRWKLWVRVFKPKGVHQVAARTRMDRYPEVFGACRDHFGTESEARLLSFGCSTGEEVMTLRQYLPKAYIVGAEINPRSLATARERKLDGRITFIHSDARNISANGPYDAIFCMAVLQRDPQLVVRNDIRNLRKQYPFEQFEETVREIDGWIKPGGLLVLHHTHYLLSDTSVASHYVPLPSAAEVKDTYAKFTRAGDRIGLEERTISIFQKVVS